MRPCADLAENVKDYDRATVRTVLEGLRRQARGLSQDKDMVMALRKVGMDSFIEE